VILAAMVTVLAVGMAAVGLGFALLPLNMVCSERPTGVGEVAGAAVWILSGLGLGASLVLLGIRMLQGAW
jgi:hypothetical protein